MTVLVFGRGFLGQKLSRTLEGAVLEGADITDRAQVLGAIERHRPTAVINAAGKTGRPNVDWCESHPVETFNANVIGALTVARACRESQTYLVHLGSGCIFYGPSPSPEGWLEGDFANPIGYYSKTKYSADLALSALEDVAVVRLRMPIDGAPDPRNLITKLAGYASVIDVSNSVTVVDDLIGVVSGLIDRRASGIFHATNPGTLRHRELIELYRELVDPSHRCEFINENELKSRGLVTAARSNCVLASPRLDALGLTMRPVSIAVRDAMKRYAKAVRQ